MKFGTPIEHSTKYMKRYDALELHAVVDLGKNIGFEQDDSAKPPEAFVTVYGHLIDPGGVFALADFKTHAAALKWMKAQHHKHKFELGYEDFWEHGKHEGTLRHSRR